MQSIQYQASQVSLCSFVDDCPAKEPKNGAPCNIKHGRLGSPQRPGCGMYYVSTKCKKKIEWKRTNDSCGLPGDKEEDICYPSAYVCEDKIWVEIKVKFERQCA